MLITLADRFPLLKALRSQPFTLLWLGQFISSIGDGVFRVALAWEVLLLTGSAAAMGLTVIASLLPTLVFLLIGGVTADRLPRRLIMLSSDTGRAIIVALVAALTWLHLLQLWHLILLSFLFGLVDSFFSPAYQSIQPQLVQKEYLPSANALTQLGRSMSGLFGPSLGAICVASAGPASAFALDAFSFVISAACLLVMRIPATVQPQEDQASAKPAERHGIRGIAHDVREGFRYVIGSSWLWVTLTLASVINLTYAGPLSVGLPRLVQDFYHSGVWLLGAIGTAAAAGTIIGMFAVGQLHHLHRRGLLAYLGLIVACLGLILLGLPFPLPIRPIIAIITRGFMGFGLGVFNMLWVTILQELVPTDKLGRVSSIDMLGSLVLLPIGVGLVGILIDQFGPALLFVIGGAISLFVVSLGLCIRSIRHLE